MCRAMHICTINCRPDTFFCWMQQLKDWRCDSLCHHSWAIAVLFWGRPLKKRKSKQQRLKQLWRLQGFKKYAPLNCLPFVNIGIVSSLFPVSCPARCFAPLAHKEASNILKKSFAKKVNFSNNHDRRFSVNGWLCNKAKNILSQLSAFHFAYSCLQMPAAQRTWW